MTEHSGMRAIRGATTVERDEPASIMAATTALLAEIATRNDLRPDSVISGFFTVTADLRSAFPARAAREMGWVTAALLCTQEIPVPDDVPRCIRVLLHVQSALPQERMTHVYLNGARVLRPEFAAY